MQTLLPLAESIAKKLIARGETLGVAESSTGGLISAALLAVPGASAYFRGGGGDETVATVGSQKITRLEFDNALREQGERLRQQMGRGFDPALLDNPEVRYAVVENLVNQRLLADEARKERFRVSDAQLAQFIAAFVPPMENGVPE